MPDNAIPWWVLLLAALLATARAWLSREWATMWGAALLWLGFSLATLSWYGPLTFLFACLHLAAAVALQRTAGPAGWTGALLLAVAVWAALFLGLAFARAWNLWPIAFPLAFAIGSLPLALPVPTRRRAR